MVTWTQMYMPMGGLGLSALVALIPIIFFFVALAVLRLKGHVAGAITLILSILIAIFAFKMPIDMAFAAAGYGFIYGLWPIAWIIVAAVFLYKLTVASGQFDIIRSSVISITDDQRLQVLLIGFSFGALLEGAAGFGAPVAIRGALVGGGVVRSGGWLLAYCYSASYDFWGGAVFVWAPPLVCTADGVRISPPR